MVAHRRERVRGRGAKVNSPTSGEEAGVLNRKLGAPHRGAVREYGLEPLELPDSIDVGSF